MYGASDALGSVSVSAGGLGIIVCVHSVAISKKTQLIHEKP